MHSKTPRRARFGALLALPGLVLAAATAHSAPMIELIENGEFESFSSASSWKRSGWIEADTVPGWSSSEGHVELWRQGVMNSPSFGSDGLPTGQHAETTGRGQNSVISTLFTTPDGPDAGLRALLSFDVWNRRGSGVLVDLMPLPPALPLPAFQPVCAVSEVMVENSCLFNASPSPANVVERVAALQFTVQPVNSNDRWTRHAQWLDLMPGMEYQLSFTGLGGGSSGAHIDQVSVLTNASVPAPAPALLLGLGLVGAAWQRRRSR